MRAGKLALIVVGCAVVVAGAFPSCMAYLVRTAEDLPVGDARELRDSTVIEGFRRIGGGEGRLHGNDVATAFYVAPAAVVAKIDWWTSLQGPDLEIHGASTGPPSTAGIAEAGKDRVVRARYPGRCIVDASLYRNEGLPVVAPSSWGVKEAELSGVRSGNFALLQLEVTCGLGG